MLRSVKRLWRLAMPNGWRRRLYDLREHLRVLQFANGHWRSVSELSSVDRKGRPLPWISYPAIEYINQLDFSTKTIFEYGAGNSTLFWASLAKEVVSVESDVAWYNRISQGLSDKPNIKLTLAVDNLAYIQHVNQYPSFDVIVIDGLYRLECAEASRPNLNPGGMMILDNSETHPHVAAYLRNSNLIQVDMIGFAPIVSKIQATSFFLQRDFAFTPREQFQPSQLLGKRWVQ
jgi:hypothetical protein